MRDFYASSPFMISRLFCLGFLQTSAVIGQSDWKPVQQNLEASVLSTSQSEKKTGFTKIDGSAIGVKFQNLLKPENIRNYILSGAGLTIADIDQNGLPDLFLVSQDGPNKLFKQNSPWVFEDVTEASGITDIKAWGSGAAFADIDNDGDLDLYVCNKSARDELYFNQGDGTFSGSTLGSGDSTFRSPTMVAFSDFDCDGDLDFYRTETRLTDLSQQFNEKVHVIKDENGNLSPDPRYKGQFIIIDHVPQELGTFDHIYQNNGPTEKSPISYQEITKKCGISVAREHGLAAVWWDYNNDHYPDLYISNDFFTPDHLYRNNKDGTFTEVTEDAFPYTSWHSMGSDFADINNDGWFDYLSTDMSATTHFKQKTMMGAMTSTSWFLDHLEPRQYMRNAMQVNTGTGKFIDIAFSTGLDSTDWTWTSIFGDLDNDGFEDVYFTNGIERNVQDSDINIQLEQAKVAGKTREERHEIFLSGPRFKEQNLAFKNLGGLKFENASEAWGLDDLSVSHGAILTDLDRDGDLDLVVNNMNDPVGIYRNESTANSILVSLIGKQANRFGLGARLEVELDDGQKLSRIITSSRGYMSGVEPVAHFGLGEAEIIPKLTIIWPGGKKQVFKNLTTKNHYRITEASASSPDIVGNPEKPLFSKAEDNLGIDFEHQENDFNDFDDQPLLPNRLSRFGPAMAITKTGKTSHIFLGGAAGQAAVLFSQDENGIMKKATLPWAETVKSQEDIAAAWFDADQDGDEDLYVVSGGASEINHHIHYRDRLYLNDGTMTLSPTLEGALPDIRESGSCVTPCDFDADGDLDLFIGARHVPGRYPTTPKSTLLINNGGKFTKADSPITDAGMVTDATWADLDGDQRPDLIVTTEWGPVKVFKNTPEGFIEKSSSDHTGWWTSVVAADFDQDGDLDLMAGNFGNNTKYHVDEEHPATLYASDFGNQGKLQLVEAQHKEGKLLPIRGRSCSTSAMPHLMKNAPSYTAFASKTLTELYTPSALDGAMKLEANTLLSMIFLNDGKGNFTAQPLPHFAQLSPVMDIAVGDFDGDGLLDAALGQNFYDAQRETGRMNAGLGVILKGDGKGTFEALWPLESGFHQRKNVRQLCAFDLNHDGLQDFISANSNERTLIHLGNSR